MDRFQSATWLLGVVSLLTPTLCHGQRGVQPEALPDSFQRLANGLTHCVAPMPGSGRFGVALVLGGGGGTDPKAKRGRARATVAGLRGQWSAGNSRSSMWRLELGPDAVVITGSHPRGATAQVMARIEHLFAGEFDHEAVNPKGLTADEAALAIGQARLAADDEINVYPGPMLEVRAHGALAPDQPSGELWRGDPVGMASLTGSDLTAGLAALADPSRAWLVVMGEFEGAVVAACLQRMANVQVPVAVDATVGAVEASGQTWQPVTDHDRVDGPFVTAAVRLRDPDGWPAILAMTALRSATVQHFKVFRGQEVNARFPFLAFDPLRGDAVACINRRGADGSSLDGVRKEIQEFLDDVQEFGLPDGALAGARKAWSVRLQVPPFAAAVRESLKRAPAGYEARAGTLARAGHRGLLAKPGVASVPDAQVAAACREALKASAIGWFALLPTTR